MTIDEAIAKYREKAEWFKMTTNVAYVLELEKIEEWLEKLKYIENIILKWNADLYNDEDNGIPDNEILEAIFNACNNNGFDIPVDEDYRKEKEDGYNKAIDDFVNACKEDILCQTFGLHQNGIERIAEQLKAGEIE